MLSLVGHPYAINPDTKLRKHARAHDWRLRDYRTGRKAVKVGVPAAHAASARSRAAQPPPSPCTAAASSRSRPRRPAAARLPACAGAALRPAVRPAGASPRGLSARCAAGIPPPLPPRPARHSRMPDSVASQRGSVHSAYSTDQESITNCD